MVVLYSLLFSLFFVIVRLLTLCLFVTLGAGAQAVAYAGEAYAGAAYAGAAYAGAASAAPKGNTTHGHVDTEINDPADSDGFVYKENTKLAQLDLREIAKGDYYLTELHFAEALGSYTTAYAAGNRSVYLLTQLGIVALLRGDYTSAKQFLGQVGRKVTPNNMTANIPVPYTYGYASPRQISTAKAGSTRTGLTVIFYLLNAQYEADDYPGYIATTQRFYKNLVEGDRVLLTMLAEANMRTRKLDKALAEVNKALLLSAQHPTDYRQGYRVKGELLALHMANKRDGIFYLNKAASLGDDKAKKILKGLDE